MNSQEESLILSTLSYIIMISMGGFGAFVMYHYRDHLDAIFFGAIIAFMLIIKTAIEFITKNDSSLRMQSIPDYNHVNNNNQNSLINQKIVNDDKKMKKSVSSLKKQSII